MLRAFALCLLSLLGAPSAAAAQGGVRVSMSASSNRVAVGEPFAVEVRIEAHGEDVDEVELPDFGELEVLGRSTARPFSFSFGFGTGGQRARIKSEIVHAFTLRATAVGAYPVRPAIVTVNGRRIASQALSIMVVQPNQGAPGPDPLADPSAPLAQPQGAPPPPGALDGARFDQTMFVRTVVDKPRAYLGEQVTVTVYLYLRGQLSDSPSITREPTLDGFWSHDLLPMQRSLAPARQEVNGRVYNTYVLRRFAAFPLRPGTLELGAPSVEVGSGGSIFDLLTGPSQPLRREGVKVSVEVQALPAQPTPGAAVHTGSLALEAALDPNQAKVGDAVTLRVSAKGLGNLRALSLPELRLANVEVPPPELEDRVTAEHDQVGGERIFRWLLLPRAPGKLVVPSMAVDVFDPASGRFSTVRTAPLKLTVSGAVAEAAPKPQEPAADDVLAPRFSEVRFESALRRKQLELWRRDFYWPAVIGAPLSLLLLFGIRLARRALARRRGAGRDAQWLREVEAKLQQAASASAGGDARGALTLLSSALKGTLEARLGEPVGGMTLRALEAHLETRGLEPRLGQRVIAQLSALERARFDPDAQGALELNKSLEGVRAAVRELARARLAHAPAGRDLGGALGGRRELAERAGDKRKEVVAP